MEIHIAEYPQLRFIAWNRHDDATVSGEEALALYERNWDYVEVDKLSADEKALIERLVKEYGNGVLHV